ncbi:MAG: outer membrane beta-barrel family protein, partial [Muribaculaceae bacterium]|nr:outer membrane beta-barrel family protein [Muribaculaceae bacterium]
VTVQGNSQILNNNKATYYPTTNEKKSATDAINLLQRMAMSETRIDPLTKKILTPDGEEISLFINYVAATEADIKGLNSSDVKKVEVIDYPEDPRFGAERHVVNIILQQYEYGGYTKLSDKQNFISAADNDASVFSRFNYKKLSFDAFIGSSFASSSHKNSSQNTVYTVGDETIGREQMCDHSKYRNWSLPVSVRSTYTTRTKQIVNTVGYTFSKRPYQDESGQLRLTNRGKEEVYSFDSKNSSRDNAVAYTGSFFFILPAGCSLSLNPFLGYSHQNFSRAFSAGIPSLAPVVTDARENAYNMKLSATLRKYFNSSHSAYISLGANDLINRIDYSGTSDSDVRLNTLRYFANMGYTFSIPSKFTFDMFATLTGSRIESNDNLNNEFLPSGGVSAYWTPSSKSRFSFTGRIVQTSIGSFAVSDVLIKQNDYLYYRGNPNLKAFSNLYTNLSYNYIPANYLALTAFASYNAGYNLVSTIYKPLPPQNAILQTTENEGKYGILSLGANITGNLLSNRLTLQVSPVFSHSRLDGFYNLSKNRFSLSAQADFYAGNFNFSAYYHTQEWTLSPVAGIWTKNRSYYYLSAGWAKNAWNLSMRVVNFLRSSYDAQFDSVSSPIYSSYTVNNIPYYHAGIELTAIFTFGYGKKVNRGNEVGRQWGAASAIQQ